MDCKILDIEAKNDIITAAKYVCSIGDVASEGWWYFQEPGNKPFSEVQEEDVIKWIIGEAGNLIEANLTQQLSILNKPKAVAPWLPQTFTPSV
jgi:hypothetical protein